ncbi:MAG: hypothetical protein H7A21_17195 [Spirochaetales bacterium]|nr:hypothetical protein [Leptospiraceae bacterium]MCP5483177.1 hypothetical protein [Spirochaetales bacterium]MCP5486681.1 hypothetical protein [Spirochaetales bacterium]
MADQFLIRNYSRRAAAQVRDLIAQRTAGTWLEGRTAELYQITDELLKNAVKANYKFLIIWQLTRTRLLESEAGLSPREVDDWLREVFFSGESLLIEGQLKKIGDLSGVTVDVVQLLELENRILRDRPEAGGPTLHELSLKPELVPLFRTKALARRLQVFVHLRVETTPDSIWITISNDSPILESDVRRILGVRRKFRDYAAQGRAQDFFIENLDTSGGGHGLGYAVMDSVLLDLGLEPEHTLYLISASRTMVLIALPLEPPAGQ